MSKGWLLALQVWQHGTHVQALQWQTHFERASCRHGISNNDTMSFVVTGQENNDAARLCHLIISSLSVSAPGVGCQQLSSIAGQSTCLLQGAGSEVVHCVVWQARHN